MSKVITEISKRKIRNKRSKNTKNTRFQDRLSPGFFFCLFSLKDVISKAIIFHDHQQFKYTISHMEAPASCSTGKIGGSNLVEVTKYMEVVWRSLKFFIARLQCRQPLFPSHLIAQCEIRNYIYVRRSIFRRPLSMIVATLFW